MGIELLRENSFEEKLEQFFELCDEDGSGTINRKEFYNLLKFNVIEYDDRNKLKKYVNEIFGRDGSGELTRPQFR